MVNANVKKAALLLAGVGALNWGLTKFFSFDVLRFFPEGAVTSLVVGTIAVSGGYVLFATLKKQI